MSNRLSLWIFLVGIVLLLCSCSGPKIKTTALVPAHYHNAAKLKAIAFLPFDGPGGRDYAMELEGALGSIKVSDKPFFTLVERQKIDRAVQEQKFSHSGLVATENAVRLGRLLGAQGIVTGTVTIAEVNDQGYREERQTCVQRERKVDKDGNVREGTCIRWRRYYVDCTRREASFSVIPKFIEVETGRVVYAATLSEEAKSSACADSNTPLSSKQNLLSMVRQKTIARVKTDIAPHYVTMEIELMDDTDGMEPDAKKRFESGLAFAQKNRMDRACELWEEALPKASQAPSLIYNVAFCLELKGNLDQSLDMYGRADRLLTEPDDRISLAIKRVSRKIGSRDKLNDQVGNR